MRTSIAGYGENQPNATKKTAGKCKELFEFADLTNKEENDKYGEQNLEELGEEKPIDSQAIEEAVKRIDERLAANPDQKKPAKPNG